MRLEHMSHLSLFAIALACCLAVNPTVAHAGSLEEDSATGHAVEATAKLEGAFEAGAVAGDATEEAAVQEDASAKGPIADEQIGTEMARRATPPGHHWEAT